MLFPEKGKPSSLKEREGLKKVMGRPGGAQPPGPSIIIPCITLSGFFRTHGDPCTNPGPKEEGCPNTYQREKGKWGRQNGRSHTGSHSETRLLYDARVPETLANEFAGFEVSVYGDGPCDSDADEFEHYPAFVFSMRIGGFGSARSVHSLSGPYGGLSVWVSVETHFPSLTSFLEDDQEDPAGEDGLAIEVLHHLVLDLSEWADTREGRTLQNDASKKVGSVITIISKDSLAL